MDNKSKDKGSVSIDVTSLSHATLVKIIEELKGSNYQELLIKAQKELVERLKRKGYDDKKIACILVANVYGNVKKKLIAQEWAGGLGITKDKFLELIGMKMKK
ncbi:MAG: hypothetical protein HZB84_03460 [Deltaproteobacteria bacterium]|nr:hypothetical protein [Deltaproteobacteria bacterium]